MRSLIAMPLPAVLLLAAAGCVEFHEAVDPAAEVCVSVDNKALGVVLAHSCTASSQRNQQFTCEVSAENSEIIVSSLFTYETKGNSTTLDCGMIVTNCQTDVPEDGTWTVVHGDTAFDVEIVDGGLPDGEICEPQ